MPPTKISDNLTPSEFVAEVLVQRLRVFLAVHGKTPFLLVRLDDPTGELLAGLSATAIGPSGSVPRLDGLGFHTVAHSSASSKRAVTPGLPPLHAEMDIKGLAQRIRATPHFVAPLVKRKTEATYMDRISVGRARNKDIVLRHGSISKFHAWFELNEEGVHVADAGSKNGASVNSESLSPRQLRRVDQGDEIKFGSVSAVLVRAEALWNVIHEQ